AAGGTTQSSAGCGVTFPTFVDPGISAQSLNPQTSDASADSLTQSDSVLRATWGEAAKDNSIRKLSPGELNWIVQAALERWGLSGISAEDMARLQAVIFDFANLADGELANANGSHVSLDETAAGYGWYYDQTPMDDSEFDVPVPGKERQATELSPADGRVDLL